MAYSWDIAEPELFALVETVLARRQESANPREILSAAFVMRVERRTRALGLLFRDGLYVDALNIVRAAFEDWITLSYYLLHRTEAEFLDGVQFEARRNRGRLFMALEVLTDSAVAAHEIGQVPQSFLNDASKRSQLPNLCDRARLLGLEDVYRFAYPFLSMMSHGDMEAYYDAMPYVDGVWTPTLPERNQNDENRWAIWAWWFHLRTLTRAADALKANGLEPYSDRLLKWIEGSGLPQGEAIEAIMRRES